MEGRIALSWSRIFIRSNLFIVHLQKRYLFSSLIGADGPKKYRERRILGYSQEQMFDIVSGVDHYPSFLPWCLECATLQCHPTKGNLWRVTVGFYPFQESYDCWILNVKPSRVRSVANQSDLFAHLINEWTITHGLSNNEKTCTVELLVDFQFRSKLHSNISGLFFDKVVNTMTGAFLARARALHGPESIPSQPPQILQYVR